MGTNAAVKQISIMKIDTSLDICITCPCRRMFQVCVAGWGEGEGKGTGVW